MGDLWLKIKAWTKLILIGVILVYALIFVWENSGQAVRVWVFPTKAYPGVSALLVMFVSFMLGVVVTLLVRTTFKTLRQIRETSIARQGRQAADTEAKAAKLQTLPQEPDRPQQQP